MKIKEQEERYLNDPKFNALVHNFVALVTSKQFSINEIKGAASLCCRLVDRLDPTPHDFEEIQAMAAALNERNFGGHFGSGYRNLLGVGEEAGELMHAHLKGEQNIRHTPDEIIKMKKDAIGDIVIFLCNYCDSQNLELSDCVKTAWDEVKNRNWSKDHEKK